MRNNPRADLIVDVLLMAVWRRQPKKRVLIRSNQVAQYTCSDWRKFLDEHNIESCASRQGNCYDNAVVESFFTLTRTERIKRKIHETSNEARAEAFHYMEFLHNPNRRNGENNGLSPIG